MNDDNLIEDLEVTDADAVTGAGSALPKPPRVDKHGTVEKVGRLRDRGMAAKDQATTAIEGPDLEPDRPVL